MKKQHTSTTAEEAEETPRTWDIERYYRRSISSTMLDVIGTVDGRPLTRLENEMRDLDGYLPDYPYEEYYKHCVRAGLISEELLNRAYGGDAAAVSKINMLAPGFIYTDIKIRGWLISHTQKTVQCTDPATARKSQDWLRDAFKIDQPEETEQPSRPVINLAYASVFGPLYIDVVAIRTAYKALQKLHDTTDENRLLPELRHHFPGLPVDGPYSKYVRMAAGVGRYQRKTRRSEQSITPIEVACGVLGNVLGYSRGSIRKKVIPCIPNWSKWCPECNRRGETKGEQALECRFSP